MYQINRNNYHLKPKPSTIYTPPAVSEFIFELLRGKVKPEMILDPCSGTGNLLKPWKIIYYTLGFDHNKDLREPDVYTDFLSLKRRDYESYSLSRLSFEQTPSLILCNPPFNGYGKRLGPEVWLDKIIELFGRDVPIVLFVPVGFCLNLTLTSQRYRKFDSGIYPPISSRITLSKNIFPNVVFHSEILIFNIPNLQPHYFYHEKTP